MRVLIFSLLVSCTYAAPQIFGQRDDFDLQSSLGGYLPPKVEPEKCVPKTIYQTSIQYSTLVRYSTIYDQQVQNVLRTEYSEQVIPTTFVSQVVRTQNVPSILYSTQFVTNTVYNTRTQFVTVPGQTQFVTITQTRDQVSIQYETRFSTRVEQVPTTIFREAVSTQVIPRPVFSTVYRTQFVTRTQQIPGQTRFTTQIVYSTVFSTQFIPARTNFLTSTAFSTQIGYSTVYARPQTQFVTSTQVVPVYSSVYSQVVDFRTQTQFATETRSDQRYTTVYSTRQVPQYVTRTVDNPVVNTRVVYSTQVIPTVVYSTTLLNTFVNVPGRTQYVTVTQTRYQSQQLPGRTQTQFVTRTVFNTNYATSTVYNTQFNTVYATRTMEANCRTGYNYQPPAVPFNF